MSSCDVQYMDEQLAAILAEEADSNYTKVSANEAINPDDDVIEEKPDQAVTTQNEVDSNNVTVNQDEETAETTTDESLATSNSDPGENSTISDSDGGWAGADPAEAGSTEKHEVPNLRPKAEDNMTKKVSTAGWEKPEPITEVEKVPFPLESLPEPYRSFAPALAANVQVPLDLVAMPMLGVLSACMMGKYYVRGRAFKQELPLYVLGVAESGERKTGAYEVLTQPVLDYQAEWNEAHGLEIKKSKAHKEYLKKKLSYVERQSFQGKATYEDVVRATEEEAQYEPMRALDFVVGDPTPEALLSRLEKYPKQFVTADEGKLFNTMKGVYNPQMAPDLSIWNNAYEGSFISSSRVSTGDKHVNKAWVASVLMVQPTILEEIFQNPVWKGNGFLARWCYCQGESLVTKREPYGKDIPNGLIEDYDLSVKKLLADENQGELIRFSPEAEDIWPEIHWSIEPRLKGDLEELSNWGGKQEGRIMRIAGILARLEADPGDFSSPTITVSRANLEAAWKIGDYLTQQFREIASGNVNSRVVVDAKRLLQKIQKDGLASFTASQVKASIRSLRDPEHREKVLKLLEAKDYIQKGARQKWKVNPYLLKAPEEAAPT